MELSFNGEEMLKKLFVMLMVLSLFISCEEEMEKTNETKVPVKVYEAKKDTISQFVRLTGSTEAENDAVIFSKISEKIDKIFVKVGEQVSADQIIAKQHNEILEQSVDLAKAAVKTAESQYKLARQNFKRMQSLFEQKAVSQQQFDQAESQYETGQAALEQTKAQLEQAEENLQNSFIKAPFSGTVAAINYEEDQMVPAGQPVAQVVNSNSMKAKLTVSGKDVNKVNAGQSVVIEFPSIPGKVYKGEVVRINKALNPVTNSLEIEVRILDADKRVKSGIFGKFNLELITRKNVIVIPEVAVQQQTEVQIDRKTGVQKPVRKYFVFKIADGKAELAEVGVGIRSDSRIEVTNGLTAKEKVVVVGQNIVKDGDNVKIID